MSSPNIILIVADDMGYGDFGMFNDGPARTPTIDALARDGICLTQHYSGSCVCAPARAALFTGRYPHRTGAIDTLDGLGLDRLGLREVTMADYFQAAGYVTGMVGKWHLGNLDPRYHPNRRGFDEFVGFCGGWSDYYRWRLDRNGSIEGGDGRYLTDVFASEAAAFVDRHAAEPFFLHVAFNAPHFPLQAPDGLVQRYLDVGLPLGVALIYAMNERMDAGVAEILDAVDRAGCSSNTLVIFTSDNGPDLTPRRAATDGLFDEFGGLDLRRFNCNFNGAKGHVYEGGIRVPLVARWSDGLPSDRRMDALVHFVDWLPTLLDVVGIPWCGHPPLDGNSVLPMLRGESTVEPARRFWQWNRYVPVLECNAAVRDGPWKLVRPRIDEAMHVASRHLQMDRDLKYRPDVHTAAVLDDIPERLIPEPSSAELYDLVSDPGEQTNLATVESRRVAVMLGQLETWFEDVESDRRSVIN